MDSTISVVVPCPFCGVIAEVVVPVAGFMEWRSGVLVQKAFPDLDVDSREQLISGICPKCWDETFGPSDETEDE